MTSAVLLTRDWALFNDSDAVLELAWSTYYRSAPFVLGLLLALFLRFAVRPFISCVQELPALSRDGKELGGRVDLWPANLLLAATMPRLDGEIRDGFFVFNRAVAALAVWAMIPAVIVAHWARYLPRHSDAVTLSQVAMSCIIFGAALAEFQRTKIMAGRLQRVHPVLASALLGCILGAFFVGVFQGWIPVHLEIAFQQLRMPLGAGVPRDFERRLSLTATCERSIFPQLASATRGFCLVTCAGLTFRARIYQAPRSNGSNLDAAIFDQADLSGTDLSCAKLVSVEALRSAKVDATTTLPDGKPGPLGDRIGLILPDKEACEAWGPMP